MQSSPSTPAASKPSADDAQAFIDRVERDLKRLWVARDQAGWVSENFITDDTEEMAARTEAATSEYVARASKDALAFRDIPLPPELARKLELLRLSQIAPAPNDASEARELADDLARMSATFGKGEYCPPKGSKLAAKDGACLHLDALSAILAQRRNNDALVEAWNGWQETSRGSKDTFARYVELGNKGSRELGFSDMGELWRSMYDMPAPEFEADMDRIWTELKPSTRSSTASCALAFDATTGRHWFQSTRRFRFNYSPICGANIGPISPISFCRTQAQILSTWEIESAQRR